MTKLQEHQTCSHSTCTHTLHSPIIPLTLLLAILALSIYEVAIRQRILHQPTPPSVTLPLHGPPTFREHVCEVDRCPSLGATP